MIVSPSSTLPLVKCMYPPSHRLLLQQSSFSRTRHVQIHTWWDWSELSSPERWWAWVVVSAPCCCWIVPWSLYFADKWTSSLLKMLIGLSVGPSALVIAPFLESLQHSSLSWSLITTSPSTAYPDYNIKFSWILVDCQPLTWLGFTYSVNTCLDCRDFHSVGTLSPTEGLPRMTSLSLLGSLLIFMLVTLLYFGVNPSKCTSFGFGICMTARTSGPGRSWLVQQYSFQLVTWWPLCAAFSFTQQKIIMFKSCLLVCGVISSSFHHIISYW